MKKINKNSDLISVVIPVYNVKKYLNRCIDSVIRQTYKKIQIVVVDDGSTDGSDKICDEYLRTDKRIQVIHKANGGLSDARNVGIKKAEGKYITFIDSDDEVTEDYIEFLYKLIKKMNADMSICSHVDIFCRRNKRHDWGTGEECVVNKKEVLEKMLYKEGFDVSACGKLYPLELFSNINFPKGKLFEDAATTYKLIDQCNMVALGLQGKYLYYIHPESIVNSDFSKEKLDLNFATEEMCAYIEKKYPDLKNATERRRLYAAFSSLNQLYKNKNIDRKAEKFLLDIIKKYRWSVLKNPRANVIDKNAIILLGMSKRIYCSVWKCYLALKK